VRPERVVLGTPSFDEHLRLPEGVGDLSINDFVPKLADDLFNTVSLPLHPDLLLKSRYCHRLTQNMDHRLGGISTM
jgi:hypothetical protein